jgi:GntR family transcriptional regulator/MocR family aminotransferase
MALLAWGQTEEGWILEDDRASELNWAATPLSTLARADGLRRVLYVGSFDHLMFPALRICYVVVPESEVAAFAQAWADSIMHCPMLEQAVLTDFIEEGHFALHIRRMRALYAERSKALSDAITPEGDMGVRLISTGGGLFSTVLLSGAIDREVALDAFTDEEALHVRPLSSFCMHSQWNGVVVGFSAIEKGNLQGMIRRLTASMRSLS